MDKVTTGVKLH